MWVENLGCFIIPVPMSYIYIYRFELNGELKGLVELKGNCRESCRVKRSSRVCVYSMYVFCVCILYMYSMGIQSTRRGLSGGKMNRHITCESKKVMFSKSL